VWGEDREDRHAIARPSRWAGGEIEMGERPVAGFDVKDCALAAIGTGKRATNLRELHDILEVIHPGCVYYHFWGVLLRPRFENPEYLNDFAEWARHGLHDQRLAERLGVIDPTEFSDLEQLRLEVLDTLEERLDEGEMVPWAKRDQQFHFIRSQIVVFDIHRDIARPEDLVEAVPQMSVGSIFYHFIDARRRTEESFDDFRSWLKLFGDKYAPLIKDLSHVDPYFATLRGLRGQLAEVFRDFFSGHSA
jgi:hypothetical protein